MRQISSGVFLYLLFLLYCHSVSGQVKNDTIGLSELIVKSLPIQNSIQNLAASVSIVTEKEIKQADGVILTSILNKVPGVYMQQGSLNTNKITIRGIGSRSQYSTTRIKAYFEEIPLTSAEGETTLEDIDLEAIDGIEIIKGPNSTGFGAGLGGVINLQANKTPNENSFVKTGTTIGSFELLKQVLSAGYSDEKSNFYTNYSTLQNEGYRSNSSYDRKSFNLFGKQHLSKNGILSLFAIGTRLKSYIPSSLSENNYINSPQKAAATWEAAKGFESYDKALIGLGYQHHFSENWSLNTSIATSFKNGYEARPFDILEDKSGSFNFRSKINHTTNFFSIPATFSIGIESITENYDFSLYKNLYQSQPGQGSIQGERFSEINQKRNNSNAFVQMNIQLLKKLYLESGLAYNSTNYEQNDVLIENKTDEKNYTFGSIWSPRLGLSYKLSTGKNMFASISKGFSTPTVAETLTPEGQINTDLKPETGINYEVGFKGNFLNSKLYTELVFYDLEVENLLVARRIADDQYMGINAGKSSHRGIEFLVNYKWIPNSNLQLRPYFSGTINDFKFTDFVDKNNDFSGNKLPAVPNVQLNSGFDLSTDFGLNINANYGFFGKMPMDDANSKYTKSYQLFDAKVAYAFVVLKKLKTEINTGMQNILNEKYSSSILPNAVGVGTAPPRYYYPGNPRNFYGGFQLTYLF
ncbi:iron complex outermembrane recepter protein [Flavobacterium fluvii]|uniref:Iron complex outermembrane recepter protein n=1 Tax=Flavobacterium fluvii TaxID=468056 RepID=A0A1M5MW94_9FLAO|nr:TonB-dependent receptor [Flavobacterium fluvii]SHG81487.1 iron complex outermembrane recepter protein [Flavobacterium fluvii]